MKNTNKRSQSRNEKRWEKTHGEFIGRIYSELSSQFEKQLNAIKSNLRTQSNLFAKGNDLIVRSASLVTKEIGDSNTKVSMESLLNQSDSWRLQSVCENLKLFIELIEEVRWDGYRDDFEYLLEEARKNNRLNYGAKKKKKKMMRRKEYCRLEKS